MCFVVAIPDRDSLIACCGLPGVHEHVKLRLAQLCHKQEATVRLEKRDRFGRTVGRVECQGKDASAHRVATGMAWAFARYHSRSPEIKRFQDAAPSCGSGPVDESGAKAS